MTAPTRQTPAEFAAHCARLGVTPEHVHSWHRRCKPSGCHSLWLMPALPGDPRWAEHLAKYPGAAADLEGVVP